MNKIGRSLFNVLSSLIISCFFTLALGSSLWGQSREIAHFTVKAGDHHRMNTPVGVSLEGMSLGLQTGQELQLYEVVDGKEVAIASQLDESGDEKRLRWILGGETPRGRNRNYILKSEGEGRAPSPADSVQISDDGMSLTLNVDDQKVLSYRYVPKPPPDGVSDLYARSGYIHPLWTPEGEVLTRIQPSDHYHHYGIWNPWTKTSFEGREIDFWNLGDGEGTVRHKALTQTTEGDIYGGFRAFLNHIDLRAPSGEKVALNESWEIKAWNADPEQDIWLIDFISTLNPAADSPVTIKAYRYQGFSLRATEKWNDETAVLLTSAGKNKSNGNGTRARWTDINGVSEGGTSGILFMTHPGNQNFPEQLRIWPTGANGGEGNVYFNFNPVQEQDWTLWPGNSYSLKYRMMVYDGKIDSVDAERYWQDFANPPEVEVQPTGLAGSRVLVYTRNGEGYVHKNIPNSIEAIRKLGRKHGFAVDASEDPSDFTEENLKKYDALIFSNTNNDIFNTKAQEKALQKYMESGGNFVGIHSASGSERDWPWFWSLVGGTFYRHAPFQEFSVEVTENDHPSTSFLTDPWVREDECYYLKQLNPEVQVLLHADMSTVEDDQKGDYPGEVFGDTFPLAWYHEFEGGRSWYTSLGHSIEDYDDPVFMNHVLGGIQWAVTGGSFK
ncbi:ThuA domain-containing protein [Fodinibius sediminis]|uniref:Type 1 glutamine amidotransferase (GATase1) n=1 Tax=Fodinibius sediminis TaxID=1214077 RepID=A0A521B1W1_9BACT|nr:ThuA domain-containing protein [Fodinibius sediminis]SMO41093.1 Type 1 glutamine amidotransferase (GATase1) [Fodinibius sediminis]